VNTLRARWAALPRSGKWLTIFVAFLLAYFAVLEPLMGLNTRLVEQADRIEASLRDRTLSAEKIENTRGSTESAISAFGKPTPPAETARAQDRFAAMERKVTEVLTRHTVTERRRATREMIPLSDQRNATGPAANLSRAGLELQIECDSEAMMNVLRDLERAAEVSAISRVDVRRISDNNRRGGGTLQVTLLVETWVPSRTPEGGRS
jgi:hypothetical protein